MRKDIQVSEQRDVRPFHPEPFGPLQVHIGLLSDSGGGAEDRAGDWLPCALNHNLQPTTPSTRHRKVSAEKVTGYMEQG